MLKRLACYFLLTFIFVISEGLIAYICIDIDTFEFKSSAQKGIRVTAFDTDNQKFEYVDYYAYPVNTQTRQSEEEIPFRYWELQIFYNGSIKVPVGFDLSGFILRTTGGFKFAPEARKIDWMTTQQDGYSLLHKGLPIQQGQVIQDQLNEFSSSRQKAGFKVYWHQDGENVERNFTSLCPGNVKENGDERGRLGELATYLTMVSFGYSRLPSQNGSNQGLDGVFVDHSEEPELFLTESKCRNESKTAKKILEQSLSESAIKERLDKMSQQHKATRERVIGFIQKQPKRIFLFAHRIRPDGRCQCFLRKFESARYQALLTQTITTASPAKDKKEALKQLQQQMYQKEPKQFLKDCAVVSKLSKKDMATVLLDQFAISQKDRERVLSLLGCFDEAEAEPEEIG